MCRANSDIIMEKASDVLQKVTERKKPAYLHVMPPSPSNHDPQDNHDTVAFVVSDDPPRGYPSIAVAPHDTLDAVVNRITRLAHDHTDIAN